MTKSSIDKYFKQVKNTKVFIGDKLEIYIPAFYAERDLLYISNQVSTLGILKMVINSRIESTLILPAKISIQPSTIENRVEDDYPYTVLTLNTGDIFISETDVVKDSNMVYVIFTTFLALGKIPPFITYDSIISLFNHDEECFGVSLGINHSIFGLIYSHMFRDANDPFKFYRHTTMKKDPIIVPLNQISHSPKSTTSKIVGSYMNEGMISALVDDNDGEIPNTIENMMRA